jgi:hypothetical protein
MVNARNVNVLAKIARTFAAIHCDSTQYGRSVSTAEEFTHAERFIDQPREHREFEIPEALIIPPD